MAKSATGYRPKDAVVARGIRGGFVPVRARELLAAWRTYEQGSIELRDLRLWLAGLELRAEARFRGEMLTGEFLGERLRDLTNDSRSLGRLARRHAKVAGLVAEVAEQVGSPDGYFRNLQRRVPMPRRLARHLAERGSRATVATAVGHLLRCLYWRGELCVSGGTAKASCLAEALGVSLRSIRRGRRELVEDGWLEVLPANQHVLNRHGAVVRIRSGRARNDRKLSPPRSDSVFRLAPPKNRDQLRCLSRTGTAQATRRSRSDAMSAATVEQAFRRMVGRGELPKSEAAKLAVLSCAEYARRCATRSCRGLFWHLLNHRLWDRPSCADEDRARTRMSHAREPITEPSSSLEPVKGMSGALLARLAPAKGTLVGGRA